MNIIYKYNISKDIYDIICDLSTINNDDDDSMYNYKRNYATKLTPNEKVLLALFISNNNNYRETARIMGVAPSTMYKYIKIILNKLK